MPHLWKGQINDVSTFHLQLCTKASPGMFSVGNADRTRLSYTNLKHYWENRNAKYVEKDKPD